MKGQNFINSIGNNFKSDLFSGKMSLYSKFKNKIFNYNIGYEAQISSVNFENQLNTKVQTQKFFANFDGTFGDDVKYYFSNAYFLNRSGTDSRKFLKMDLEVVFLSLKKNWEFSIIGSDILNFNSTQLINNSLQNNYLRETITDRLPGYLGAGIKYKLL